MSGFRTARRISLLGLAASCLAFAVTPKTYELPANLSHGQGWVVADLDGDRVADLAASGPGFRDGRDYLHQIKIDLTGSPATSFTVRGASPSIRLTFRDIDGDHDRDLIVFEPSSPLPIGIWLNDGTGHFTEGRVSDYLTRLGTPDSQSFANHHFVKGMAASLRDERTHPDLSPVVAYARSFRSAFTPAGSFFVAAKTLSGNFSPRGPPSRL